MSAIIHLGARSTLSGLTRRDRVELFGADLAEKVLEPRKMRVSKEEREASERLEAEQAAILRDAAFDLGLDPELAAQALGRDELVELVPNIAARAAMIASRRLPAARK